MASDNIEELLFFDTFSHDTSEEINLDLVQFPKPVVISEIRIIPLGARVQADFPGGVRLGATNPSQFNIEFFVNDLSKTRASTFESLGGLEYRQNVDIQLECSHRKIPTDGLVLKGWYTTITLAIYGTLSKVIQPVVPSVAVPDRRPADISTSAATAEWVQQHAHVPDRSQENMYIDQGYTYPPDYQATSQEHGYVESWPMTVVSPSSVSLPHGDAYGAAKDFEGHSNWGTARPEAKSWEDQSKENDSKHNRSASPGRSVESRDWNLKGSDDIEQNTDSLDRKETDSNEACKSRIDHDVNEKGESVVDIDDKDKLRNRDDRDKYWDENSDVRKDRDKSKNESERDEIGRDRRSEKDRDWRRREGSDDRDRHSRDKEKKERDENTKEDERDRGAREERRSGKERGRSSLREDRTRERSISSLRGRRDRERSVERGSWHERSTEPSDRLGQSKGYRENSWEKERERSPYSEASSYRRRPMSPPSRSPKRPYTPTERFWSPDRRGQSPQNPLLSPAKYSRNPACSQSPSFHSPMGQDDPSLDDEQFEPILSDEDIIDENDSPYPDIDYDLPDDMEEVVKSFNPFTFQVQPLEYFLDPSLTNCEKEKIYAKRNKTTTKSPELTRIETVIKSVQCDNNSSVKEDWVEALEQLLPLLDKGLAHVDENHHLVGTLMSWVDVGLNLDVALLHSQPGYKVRHLKAGIRLAEALCWCGAWYVNEMVVKNKVQEKFLELFHREYMASSIKLMLLKALDASLISEKAIDYFLTEKFVLNIGNGDVNPYTGYQHLFHMLEQKQLVRIKVGLTSLIKKIHVYEVTENLKLCVEKAISNGDCEYENDIAMYLREIEKDYVNATITLSQPKRFLPVQSQFEVNITCGNTYVFLYKYFKIHGLLEILLWLLSNRKTSSSVSSTVQSLMKMFSERHDGLLFLSWNPEVTNNIMKMLACQTTDEYIEVIPGTTTYLGVEMICRLQVVQLLDKLIYPENEDAFEIVHELFCVSFTPVGKLQISFVLSMEDNVRILLDIFQSCNKKAAVRNYIQDLLVITVKYSDDVAFLKKYGKALLDLAEEDKQCQLFDVIQWLKPLEAVGVFSHDDISTLCEILKKYTSLEGCGALPGDLITCVRILKHLGIPKSESDLSVHGQEEDYTELKYKYVILQMYSLDCLSHLNSILMKILEYYEQPYVHAINLLGPQGSNLLSFVEPCIMLMRRMLTYVISVRNNEYKDLTHVNVFIQVYTLMQAFPPVSECYSNAQKVSRDIVETLLAYTQPVASENASENETFTKSLWTLMVSDVLKYITRSSFTFIPGFLLLSELLPLPIPIPTRNQLEKDEINQIINSRRLWSAHLHNLSPIMHDLIATMAGSSYAPLLQLVRRVCLQLADLAAPTALVISRSVLDPLLTTLQRSSTGNPAPGTAGSWDVPCSAHTLRLLNFLACLVSHASIKAAVLNLLTVGNGLKSDEKFLNLVSAFSVILRTPGNVITHGQVQEHVILIIQSFFDFDLTLVTSSNEFNIDKDVLLANALPSRDLLVSFITALLDHIANPGHSFSTILSAIKALLLLTEHDYGFFHLKSCIDGKSDAIWALLVKLCNGVSREHADSLNVLCSTLELFRELVTIGEDLELSPLPSRKIAMTATELSDLLRWKWKAEDKPHPIIHLRGLLKEWSASDESILSLYETMEDFVKLMNTADKAKESKELVEPVLPATMSLSSQFSSRPVYVICDTDDKRLSSDYWLSPPTCDDSDQEMDQVTCDLMDLAANFLPDLHLPHEVERVCMLKSTEDEEDPKKPEISKYQFSGVRTRRPFITPMRGRGIGRAAPQRGDLFRSRPPNTSRPPSLHVDDFVALETCGQQPTGPTGYNKISMRAVKDIIATRTRGRGRAYAPERGRFFGAPTYPRRDSPRGMVRGRGSWLVDELASSRVFHATERLPLRPDAAIGRFIGRRRGVTVWNSRSEQFGGMPIRGVKKDPIRHLRAFTR